MYKCLNNVYLINLLTFGLLKLSVIWMTAQIGSLKICTGLRVKFKDKLKSFYYLSRG